MKIMLDDGAYMPTRAHSMDAGLDLYSPVDVLLMPQASAVIDTGVHVELPPGSVGFLKSKSGLNVRHGILGEGVIDAGYIGSIRVKLYNHSGDTYNIRRGDKITQLVILPVILPDLEQVDSLEDTERGCGGFGSTGR